MKSAANETGIAQILIKNSYDYYIKGQSGNAAEMLARSYDISRTLPEYYYVSNLLLEGGKKNNFLKEKNADGIIANLAQSFFIGNYDLLKQCAKVYENSRQYRKSYDAYMRLISLDDGAFASKTIDHEADFINCLKMLFNSDIPDKIPSTINDAKKYFDSTELEYLSLLYGISYGKIPGNEFNSKINSLSAKKYDAGKLLYLKALHDTGNKNLFNEYSNNAGIDVLLKRKIIHAMLNRNSTLTKKQISALLADWAASGGLADSKTSGFTGSRNISSVINSDETLKKSFFDFSGESFTDADEDGEWEEKYVHKNGKLVEAYYDENQDGINEYEIVHYDDGKINVYTRNKDPLNYEKFYFNASDQTLESVEFYSGRSPVERYIMMNSAGLSALSVILKLSKKELLFYTNVVETSDTVKKRAKYYNGVIQHEFIDDDGSGYFEYRKFFTNGIIDRALKDVDENGIFEIKEEYANGKIIGVYSKTDESYSGYDYKEIISGDALEKFWDSNHDGIYEMKFTGVNDGFKFFDVNFNGSYDFVLESRKNPPTGNTVSYALYEIRNGKWFLLRKYPDTPGIKYKNWNILSIRDIDNMEIPESIDTANKIYSYKNKRHSYENDELKNEGFNFHLFIFKNQIYLLDMMR